MHSILLALVVGAAAGDIKTAPPQTGRRSPTTTTPGLGSAGSTPTGTLGSLPTGSGALRGGLVPGVQVQPGLTPQVGASVFGVPRPALVNPDGSLLRAPGTEATALTAPDVRGVLTPRTQLQQLDTELGGARKAEATGGEGAVAQSLDKVFDAAKRAAGGGAAGAVAGRVTEAAQKVKQLVSVGNTAAPRDAPKLYAEAIDVARKALPAPAAAQVRAAVVRSAENKARLSLGALAASAYQAAATGRPRELEQELKGLEGWSELLGSPEAPLIANKERLVSDIRRVAAERPASTPRVFFRERPEGNYDAVLPLSSVAPVPAKLITAVSVAEEHELTSPDAVVESALAELKRGNGGAGTLYRAARRMGASVPSAALTAAGFSLRSLLYSLWDRLLDLVGRGPSAIARGGAVISQAPLAPGALAPYELYGKLADAEAALAFKLSGRSIDLAVLAEARAAAAVHEQLTGDRTGRLAVETLAVRLERRREFPEADARALGRWLARLRDDGLRHTVKAKPVLGSNVKLGGRWSAAQGSEGAATTAAERLLAEVPSIAGASLVLDGPRLWLSRPGFKAFLDARPTDEGGRLAFAVEGDAALPPGVAVERRGKVTLGWIDGEIAAAGAPELTAALILALGAGEARAADPDLDRVAGRLREPQASALAAVLRDHDAAPLSYAVIGELDGRPALRSRRGRLSITVLRDPLTGEPSRAVAELAGKPVAAGALRGLLRPQ